MFQALLGIVGLGEAVAVEHVLPDPLCPELVVRDEAGVTLLIHGAILATQQEEIVEVTHMSDSSHKPVMRIFVSESGKDSAVLFETAFGLPIALLDTGTAIKEHGPVEANAHVLISRASAFLEHGDHTQSHFAVARPTHANTVVITKGGKDGGQTMLTMHTTPGVGTMSVSDGYGLLVASLEPNRSPYAGKNGEPNLVLHVRPNADVSLILAAVVAATKLSASAIKI